MTVAVLESRSSLLRQAGEVFAAHFGHRPSVWAAAPGRVNLIGEHVDYHGGCVLPMAINAWTVIAAAPREGEGLTLYSQRLAAEARIDPSARRAPSGAEWAGYAAGVVHRWQREGLEATGLDAAMVSSVPIGAGLSSSAAMSVATATLLEQVSGHRLGALRKAKWCREAEAEFAGVACGLMDPLAVSAGVEGCALLLDCAAEKWRPVRLPAEVAVIVGDTQVRHELGASEYGLRQRECAEALATLGADSWRQVTIDDVSACAEALGERLRRRSRHVVTELLRAEALAAALERGDLEAAGEVLRAGHVSLREDYEVSCAELDALAAAAEGATAGRVYGARMTGAGFGGCIVALAESGAAEAVMAETEARYQELSGRSCTLFRVWASDGAVGGEFDADGVTVS